MKPFTDDRREALRERVRAFAAGLPRRGKNQGEFKEIVRALGAAGLLRLSVPSAFGGDTPFVESVSQAVVREELSFASGLADAMFAVQGLGSHPIIRAGSAETRRRWLPGVATGGSIAAFAVTEPEAGSDLNAVATTARAQGDGYVLDGQKVFISNAEVADFFVVLARADSGKLSMFVVPAASEGIETSPVELLASHPVGMVRLRGVRVARAALLGAEGDGLSLCLSALEFFRPTVGAAACGLAARAFDEACKRVQSRKQFGAVLAKNQSVQFALAEMSTRLAAARLLVYRAAWMKEEALRRGDDHARFGRAAAEAKLFATESAQEIVDQALQLHGASGLVRGGTMEALYREVRALRIYEGTSEVQKMVIAREILAG